MYLRHLRKETGDKRFMSNQNDWTNGAPSESARTGGINSRLLLRDQLERGPPVDGGNVAKASQETG